MEDHIYGMRGELVEAMYGTRDAAQDWERKYNDVLAQLGFVCGRSCSGVFWHHKRRIRSVVRGDDSAMARRKSDLE